MHLSDIPVEILLHDLFPIASIGGVLRLGCTSKFFASICSDDAFWKGKCRTDFANLSGTGVFSRKTGWKALYRAFNYPRVFVWGSLDKGTRGIGRDTQFDRNAGFPYPVEVPFPRTRIVSLVTCDRGFQALDSEGSMWVWGTSALTPKDEDDGVNTAYRPHKFVMPNPITAISCTGMQVAVIDSAAQFWTFLSWRDPFRLKSPLLDGNSPETTPLHIACGWSFTAILTHSKDVLVFWWTTSRPARTRDEDPTGSPYTTEDYRIFCVPGELTYDPARLPQIPRLPNIEGVQVSEEPDASDTFIVEIAALELQLIALTNKGHVLKFHDLRSDRHFEVSTREWEYLEQFSEPSRIAQHLPSRVVDSSSSPTFPRINRITARNHFFAAYSTADAFILMGTDATRADDPPSSAGRWFPDDVLAAVALDDGHYAALSADGTLRTWGSNAHGALGLGDLARLPPDAVQVPEPGSGAPLCVAVPSCVRFGNGALRTLCVGVTAARSHMGALVVELPVRAGVRS
ncbi:regulator of chromosome condensation 1/beta-lactamase-inhibitor protein II [Gloeopeniophorella convolvens]|nr:regulator of chromosome condensation 1/beta-lactamase-inhibitor protein II [Gloeopeniophorella convolvens]